ncbi:MAG: hypothetical protein U0N15_02845 [Bifidobacterium choerinum]
MNDVNDMVVRAWLYVARPDMASRFAYGRRILARLASTRDAGERDVLRAMAVEAADSLDVMLDDMADDYMAAGPARRRLIAGVERRGCRLAFRLHHAGKGPVR